jgi:hypothetical protein
MPHLQRKLSFEIAAGADSCRTTLQLEAAELMAATAQRRIRTV